METLKRRLLEELRASDDWTRLGAAIGSGYAAFVLVLLVASGITEGGWTGLALSVAWVALVAGLLTAALLRPPVAASLLAALVVPLMGFGVWRMTDYEAARTWENAHGPIELVLLVTLVAGLLLLGLEEPMMPGVLVLVAAVVPPVMALAGAGAVGPEVLAAFMVTAPLAAAGAMYVWAGTRRAAGDDRPAGGAALHHH
jgi:hypothetical protein